MEAAQAAGRTPNTALSTQYHRLKLRKDTKRAAIAVAHTLLVITYHLLNRKTTYHGLGSNYLDQQDRERVSRQLTRRLERLDRQVSLESVTANSSLV